VVLAILKGKPFAIAASMLSAQETRVVAGRDRGISELADSPTTKVALNDGAASDFAWPCPPSDGAISWRPPSRGAAAGEAQPCHFQCPLSAPESRSSTDAYGSGAPVRATLSADGCTGKNGPRFVAGSASLTGRSEASPGLRRSATCGHS